LLRRSSVELVASNTATWLDGRSSQAVISSRAACSACSRIAMPTWPQSWSVCQSMADMQDVLKLRKQADNCLTGNQAGQAIIPALACIARVMDHTSQLDLDASQIHGHKWTWTLPRDAVCEA